MREGGGEGGRGSCGGGTRVGQTFPWQDPRDTAEARVQPVKERLRAQQSISGSHFHNKWSSHSFCSRSLAPSLARTHVIGECIHSRLISTRQRTVTEEERAGGGGLRRGGGSYLLEWPSANTKSTSIKNTDMMCRVAVKSTVAERSALAASAFKAILLNN